MKISQLTLKCFRGFSDLTIRDIPATARLVVMAGPNGLGKSSVFDAMHQWRGWNWDPTYHEKVGTEKLGDYAKNVSVVFHGEQPKDGDPKRKAIYARTAYRNDPEFMTNSISRQESMVNDGRIQRMIDTDASVGKNYQRLAAQGLEDLYEAKPGETTFAAYREESIGVARDAMERLFPGLVLKAIGNPMKEGTFRFDKGISKGFLYKNLSGGEKAAFDRL